MDLNPDIIKDLKKTADQKRGDAVTKILNGDTLGHIQTDLEYAAAIDRLIPEAGYNRRRLRASAIFAAFCLLGASLLWSTPVWWKIPLSLKLTATNIKMELAEEWSQPGLSFHPTDLFVDHVKTYDGVGLIPKTPGGADQGLVALSAQNGNLSLNGMAFDKGADIEIGTNNKKLNFFIKKSPLKSQIQIEKGQFTIETDTGNSSRSFDDGVPETIRFQTEAGIGAPVRLELGLGSTSEWLLHGFKLNSLEFLDEFPPNSGRFESTALSGSVRLPDMKTEEKIRQSDHIQLTNLDTRRVEISPDTKGLNIFLEGLASGVRVGPKGFEKNLTPTLLEYLYQEQKMAFFWGAVVFLWGMLWGIRDLLFKK